MQSVMFDKVRVEEARAKQWDNAVLLHNMTTEHTEILGQFLDQTGLSPQQLIDFLLLSVIRFNAFGWETGRSLDELKALKRCKDCKIDCLLKEYDRVKEERDRAVSREKFIVDGVRSLIRRTAAVERDL